MMCSPPRCGGSLGIQARIRDARGGMRKPARQPTVACAATCRNGGPSTISSTLWAGPRRGETRRSGHLTCAVSEKRAIPVFPLSIVPLPYTQVPLHIFEARYRVLFHTLLSGMEGCDEGLVDRDGSLAPFLGSKEFGMCFIDRDGAIASIGGLLSIEEFKTLDDGRLYVQNTALQRFKILEVVEQKPVLICEVEFIDEAKDYETDQELMDLAKETGDVFMRALSLGLSLDGQPEPKTPEQLEELEPLQLSYWLASLFPQDPSQQQRLLQVDGPRERLEMEKEILTTTYNYHLARSSLKNAFPGGEEASE